MFTCMTLCTGALRRCFQSCKWVVSGMTVCCMQCIIHTAWASATCSFYYDGQVLRPGDVGRVGETPTSFLYISTQKQTIEAFSLGVV